MHILKARKHLKRHPPCGGCGLKYQPYVVDEHHFRVTLRVEGVD